MPEVMKNMRCMVMVLLPLVAVACTGAAPGGAKMEVAELGLSMDAPPGWRVERNVPGTCTKGDSSGVVISEPLEGRSFAERADTLSQGQSGQVLSKSPTTIAGCEAIQAVVAYPTTGAKAMKAYIHKGNTLIEVSFVTPEPEFAASEPSFRACIGSIEIR